MHLIAAWTALTAVAMSLATELSPADQSLKRHFPAGQVPCALLVRAKFDERQDLVVLTGGPRPDCAGSEAGTGWWDENAAVGVFLQERDAPERSALVTLLPGKRGEGSLVRVERLAAGELFLQRIPEKGINWPPALGVFFDPLSAKLIRTVPYLPQASVRIETIGGVPHVVTSDRQHTTLWLRPGGGSFTIAGSAQTGDVYEKPHSVFFGPAKRFELTSAEHVIVEHRSNDDRQIRVPQSRVAENVMEEIGPYQLEGDKLWFGKTFYAGEGQTGTGAFGYFDSVSGKFEMYSPPEVEHWSVTALHVDPDAVWMALQHRGEYGGPSGGVLRLDRTTHAVQTYAMESHGVAMVRYGRQILVGTEEGVAVIEGDSVREYFVGVTAGGAFRVLGMSRRP